MRRWLAAFLLTQIVEVAIYTYAMRRRAERGPSRPALVAFAASAITHPIVWFVIPGLWPGGLWQDFAVAETFAVVVEALWLKCVGKLEHAFAWSLGANLASVAASFVTRYLFSWP